MFHNENRAGKRRSSVSPSMCCLQGIRFPCAESLLRLVQPPLSPLPSQAEQFQSLAEQWPLHFWLRLLISWTRGHRSRISSWISGIPTRGRSGSFPIDIWTNRPIEIWTNKSTRLVDCASCCADPHLFTSSSFSAPGVGGTLIRAYTLSQRPQTFCSCPIASCVARDPLRPASPVTLYSFRFQVLRLW